MYQIYYGYICTTPCLVRLYTSNKASLNALQSSLACHVALIFIDTAVYSSGLRTTFKALTLANKLVTKNRAPFDAMAGMFLFCTASSATEVSRLNTFERALPKSLLLVGAENDQYRVTKLLGGRII